MQMAVETQEATRRVNLVATTSPETLPQCAEFAWTAPLTSRQREQMQQEAQQVLRDEPECQRDGRSCIERLNYDWLSAAALLGQPEALGSLPPDWSVSDAWFYTPEWQAKEREADADFAAGRFTRYYSAEEFLVSFDERAAQHADIR